MTELGSRVSRALRTELDRYQRAAPVSWVSFATTFGAVRGITWSIRAGRGPFRNLSAGGEVPALRTLRRDRAAWARAGSPS